MLINSVIWIAGITLGVGVIGQAYAWICNRPNPVLNVCGTILEELIDLASDIDFGGD